MSAAKASKKKPVADVQDALTPPATAGTRRGGTIDADP